MKNLSGPLLPIACSTLLAIGGCSSNQPISQDMLETSPTIFVTPVRATPIFLKREIVALGENGVGRKTHIHYGFELNDTNEAPPPVFLGTLDLCFGDELLREIQTRLGNINPGQMFADAVMNAIATDQLAGDVRMAPLRDIPEASADGMYDLGLITNDLKSMPSWSQFAYGWSRSDGEPLDSVTLPEGDVWILEPLLDVVWFGENGAVSMQAGFRLTDARNGDLLAQVSPSFDTIIGRDIVTGNSIEWRLAFRTIESPTSEGARVDTALVGSGRGISKANAGDFHASNNWFQRMVDYGWDDLLFGEWEYRKSSVFGKDVGLFRSVNEESTERIGYLDEEDLGSGEQDIELARFGPNRISPAGGSRSSVLPDGLETELMAVQELATTLEATFQAALTQMARTGVRLIGLPLRPE
jgi:hypothetical protein